jgi:hypothetical protein
MLGGRIDVTSHAYDQDARRLQAVLALTNTGAGVWLASGADRGAVNLGARLLDTDGRTVAELPRHAVATETTPVGGRRTLEAAFDLPPVAAAAIEFDLVAEGVGWFSDRGSPTARIDL